MSSRTFQGVIIQMKEATDRTVGVVDFEGTIVACSELSLVGSEISGISYFADTKIDSIVVTDGTTFKFLGNANSKQDYFVFVEGTDEIAKTLCVMAWIAVSEAKIYYEEKHDKNVFLKNVLTDNILPGDIYVYSKELNFVADAPRAVILIRQKDKADAVVMEILQRMFPERLKDFVLSVNENDIVLIKEVSENTETKDLMKIASSIEATIKEELAIKTVIGIGTIARHIKELADHYKEAQTAIEIGKVFDSESNILSYESLGIGRLIYQLPVTLCEMFLSEVFKKNPIDSLDQETLAIIAKFFENSLNISETSRKLFVHRNTLVYRLSKIKKITGLDLREFDQAIVFQVALMVKKYLNYKRGLI